MAVTLAAAALGGCAGEGGRAGMAERAALAAQATAPFEGWYKGRQVSVAPGPTCRSEERTVWFRVKDGLVEMRHARHRRSGVRKPIMAGTVAPGGEVVMRADSSDRLAIGRIQGDRLTAADDSGLATPWGSQSRCLRRYEAVRGGEDGEDEREGA